MVLSFTLEIASLRTGFWCCMIESDDQGEVEEGAVPLGHKLYSIPMQFPSRTANPTANIPLPPANMPLLLQMPAPTAVQIVDCCVL